MISRFWCTGFTQCSMIQTSIHQRIITKKWLSRMCVFHTQVMGINTQDVFLAVTLQITEKRERQETRRQRPATKAPCWPLTEEVVVTCYNCSAVRMLRGWRLWFRNFRKWKSIQLPLRLWTFPLLFIPSGDGSLLKVHKYPRGQRSHTEQSGRLWEQREEKTRSLLQLQLVLKGSHELIHSDNNKSVNVALTPSKFS